MTKTHRRLISPLVAIALSGIASVGRAQVDVNPPRPNVMLLVDNSGSMEYKTGTTTYPTCVPNGTGSEKSRWIDLVEVLTGTIPSYRCEKLLRNSLSFKQEYAIVGASPTDGLNPRDYLYPVPYHRPMSGTCSPTPDQPNQAVGFCTSRTGGTCSAGNTCQFPKTEGGLLDAFANEVRFGLMTFDTLPDASKNMVGTWSYIVGQPARGAPKDCSTLQAQEVGARNASAPMWEGRMVAFGPPVSDDEVKMLNTRNEEIQKILISTRPFGATPIAGLLRDAQDFFWNEDGENLGGDKTLAPKNDPFSTGKCRDNFAILLTDGEPNMDLRPDCQGYDNEGLCGKGVDACCPFKRAEDYAFTMADPNAKFPIKTYVVGFAVTDTGITNSNGEVVKCQDLTPTELNAPDGLCNQINPPKSLKICCTLNRIAYNGGTNNAYFASTVEGLRGALATILSEAAKGTTSRTFPVFASAAGSSSGNSTFRFFTSFKPKIDGSGLWQGVIERQRFECEGKDPVKKDVDPDYGDDFVKNVNSAPALRTIHSIVGNLNSNSKIDSTFSIRMQASSSDGIGTYSGTEISGAPDKFPELVPTAAMDITTTPCVSDGTSGVLCRDRYLKWLVGGDNGTDYQRCANTSTGNCNLIADVYHSVPAVVGAPRESLRDEGYLAFSRSAARKRPIVLYTSTNDGFLHAFKVASNDPDEKNADQRVQQLTNNELWSFIPPAVLPRIPTEYPNVHQLLLDGAPVVRDVPGTKPTGAAKILLERSMSTTSLANADWRTILVQSFGGKYPGYFALDVTDPVAGPRFLWQLTTDSSGNLLFGDSGGTPTITTLYFDPTGGSSAREIPVALLPGGDGGTAPVTTADCDRDDSDAATFDDTILPRAKVPCYTDAAAKRARSLTIVRLDNGEIIRTFRRNTGDAPASISSLVSTARLTSPITGQPVAYPGWTGAIADRAFVGDRDGNLWRLDLSSLNPAKWSMKLFFDAYHGKSAHAGQPIATTPIISTNSEGEVVVLFSTGNQDDLMGTAQSLNYVYSLREQVEASDDTKVSPVVNWFNEFSAGKRVAGPMTLFASVLYFSTYTPPSTDAACESGSSSIWGVDFVIPKSSDLSEGGKAALPEGGVETATTKVQELVPDGTLIAKGSTIFGVGVAQIQSCYTTGDSVTDPYFGQQYAPISDASPATYQLVVQTGKAGNASGQSSTKVATINLPPQNLSPRISSWALVME